MPVHVTDPMQMLSEAHLQHIWRTHELTSVAWNQAKFSQNREFELRNPTPLGAKKILGIVCVFT